MVVACIGISAPVTRFPNTRLPVAAAQVCEAAKEVNAILSTENSR
jgi:hypothetical protein